MSNTKNITSITVVHEDGSVRTIRGTGTLVEVQTRKRADVPDEKRGKRGATQAPLEPYTYFTATLFPDGTPEEVVAAVESDAPSSTPDESVPPSQNAPEES